MKISIITICYNSEKTIRDTIHSVISQTWNNIEYIIVDGDSTDGTLSIIKESGDKIHKIISEKDEGIYDAMNKGIRAATGDVIGILNSDDIFADENVISDIVQVFSENNCDSLYADLVYVGREETNRILRYWKSGPYHDGIFKKGWMPPHPTFFVKREIYQQYGLFNTSLKSAADYEIMLRFLHRYKISVCYLPRIITKMRTGGQSNITLRNRIKANREDKKAWELNGLRPGMFTLIRKPLSKVFQFIRKG